MYNIDVVECCAYNTIYKKWFETISGELRSNVNVLREMIEVRDGVKSIESLSMEDVLFVIDDICIN